MQRIDGQGNITGERFDFFKSRWFVGGVAAAAAAAAAFFTAATSHAAVIMPVTNNDVSLSNPSSVFDASGTGNTYSLGSDTRLIPAGFDARDLFGGSFGTFGPEGHDIIFENYQAIGSVDLVNATLNVPMSLTGFNLYLEDDGTGGERSASEFKLFGDGQLIEDISILDSTGSQSYTSVYGSNYIQLSDTLSDVPYCADYTLEFVQNRDAGNSSGVRALEFQATGNPQVSVPEPASATGMLIGGLAMLSRRKRRLPINPPALARTRGPAAKAPH